MKKAITAAAKQGGAADVKEAASVSSPAAAAEQKSVNGKATAHSSSGSSSKAAGEKPLSSKAGQQRAALSTQAEAPIGSVSHAVFTSTAEKAAAASTGTYTHALMMHTQLVNASTPVDAC